MFFVAITINSCQGALKGAPISGAEKCTTETGASLSVDVGTEASCPAEEVGLAPPLQDL
jgi:hypothetical protein